MLNPDIVRKATRLTRAGRLIEATALLQRMLRADDGPARARPLRAEPAKLQPPTIDVKANVVGQGESRPTANATSIPGRKYRSPFGGLKDFLGAGLRSPGKPVAPSTSDIVPGGTKFVDGSFRNAAGSRTYKLFVPSGANELPCGRTELLRCLSRTAERSQPGQVLELVSLWRSTAGPRRAFADRWHHPSDHARLSDRSQARLCRRSVGGRGRRGDHGREVS